MGACDPSEGSMSMDLDARRQEARRLRAAGVPLKEIASKLGISASVACVYCKGVLAKYGRAKYADRTLLIENFTARYHQGIPVPAIARQMHIPATTLFGWRRSAEIQKNSRTKYVTEELRKKIGNKLTVDRDGKLRAEAIRLYVDEQLATPEIAARLAVTSVTVGVWLQQAGVERRKNPTMHTREKLRAANLGSKRYNWKGGITGEQRRKRLSLYMRQAREACFKRDNYTCKCCGQRGGKLNAHHIWPFQTFPQWMYETWNLATLCKRCHDAFHNAGGGAVKPAIGPFFYYYGNNRVEEQAVRYGIRGVNELKYGGNSLTWKVSEQGDAFALCAPRARS